MDILTAENDLVTRLSGGMTYMTVSSFAEPAAEVVNLNVIGSVVVQYAGSNYSASVPNRKKTVDQNRTVRWVIGMIYRNIVKHTGTSSGAYTYLELIRSRLTGYTVTGLTESTVLRPVSDRFVGRGDAGEWIYEMVFEHQTPEAAAFI